MENNHQPSTKCLSNNLQNDGLGRPGIAIRARSVCRVASFCVLLNLMASPDTIIVIITVTWRPKPLVKVWHGMVVTLVEGGSRSVVMVGYCK